MSAARRLLASGIGRALVEFVVTATWQALLFVAYIAAADGRYLLTAGLLIATLGVCVGARRLGVRLWVSEDEVRADWVHADLSQIPMPRAHPPIVEGPLLPWYRRILRRERPVEEAPPPPLTYRG